MRFLVDNQLPRRLARWLSEKGHQAEHVLDLNLAHLTPDQRIWDYAMENRCVVITKDADFVDLVILSSHPVQVVLICLGNCRNAALVNSFEKALDSLCQQIESGETLIELW